MNQQRILRCPSCSNRFDYEQVDAVPANLICPKCGRNHSINEYYALMACPHCAANLEIPWQLLSEEALTCPQCDKTFCPVTLSAAAINSSSFDSNADALCRLGSAPKRMLQDNECFGKYKIISLLGMGGMSEVYLAEHVLLKQLCALKVMKQSLYEQNDSVIKRFVREAKLSHSIKHPNIVGVYDVGNDPKKGFFFIAMEYIQGKNLLSIVQDHLFTEKELYDVVFSMSKVLIELDKHKIVHRDIKPSNIMVNPHGVLKLMDLGIAKSDADSFAGEMTLTMDNSAIGTPSYASPEQCQSAHSADQRSDIYCLGATLYHLASGKLPFEGDTPMAILLKVVQTDPFPLSKLRPDLSPKMISLIEKMMKKDPAQRPQSGSEILMYLMRKDNALLNREKKILAASCAAFTVFLLLIFLFLKINSADSKQVSESPDNSQSAARLFCSKIPATMKLAKNVSGTIDLKSPPKPGEDGRNIDFRLLENYWMIQYMGHQPDTVPFKLDKIIFLEKQRDILEKVASKRKALNEKAAAAAIDADLKTSLQQIVRQYASGKDISAEILGKTEDRLRVGLKSSLINPNSTLNLDGRNYTLLELILKGYLPFPQILGTLLAAGADPDRIDAVYLPLINKKMLSQQLFMNLLHILQSGRNNIDTWNNESLLSLVLDSKNYPAVFSAKSQILNWSLVEFILLHRGLTSFRDQNNRSVAHYAAAWNQKDVLEILILSGFKEINAPDKAGMTPYQLALRNGATAAAEILEKYNFQTSFSDADQDQGEFLRAIEQDDFKKILAFAENDSLLSCEYANHLTPLQIAISHKSNQCAVYLCMKDTNKTDSYISHSLFIAVSAGNVTMFKYLLESNASLDLSKILIYRTRNQTYSLPLHIVYSNRRAPLKACALLDALLKNNWQINSPVMENSSATLLQIIKNDPSVRREIKNYLLQNGAQ